MKHQKIPSTEHEIIAKKRLKGETLKSIAKPYGATRERIRQILRDHFPEIETKEILKLRKRNYDREREQAINLCACGCGTTIPRWTRYGQTWRPARRYFPGHQGRNRGTYERSSESRTKSSKTKKEHWAMGVYDNKVRKDTIQIRRKLWKILREHPNGLSITKIKTLAGISRTTALRWIKTQKYMKFDVHRSKEPGHPYVVKLARESPVNLEDEKNA